MEEMSSSSMSNIASGEIGIPPKKKPKKRIKWSAQIFDEALSWIKRMELVQSSLSFSSCRLNGYCWPYLHGKVTPCIVSELLFYQEIGNDCRYTGRAILANTCHAVLLHHYLIPIADIDPPKYITGFGLIELWFIDNRVLQFMGKIIPVFKEEVAVKLFSIYDNSPLLNSICRVMAMLAPKADKLELDSINSIDFIKFNRQFPNFISGLRSIHCNDCTVDDVDEEDWELVVKWLNAPREDGKVKMLSTFYEQLSNTMDLIEVVKWEFWESTQPANFIIKIDYDEEAEEYDDDEEEEDELEDFKLEKEETGETLELYRHDGHYFIVRHKNDESTPRVDWEEQFEREADTTIEININQYTL